MVRFEFTVECGIVGSDADTDTGSDTDADERRSAVRADRVGGGERAGALTERRAAARLLHQGVPLPHRPADALQDVGRAPQAHENAQTAPGPPPSFRIASFRFLFRRLFLLDLLVSYPSLVIMYRSNFEQVVTRHQVKLG